MTATLYVCTTCRAGHPAEGERPGARLHAELADSVPANVRVVAVECLSACDNGCTVALSAPGKWSYVYGHMDPDRDVSDIVDGAAKYAASTDGIVPWRERPVIFRKQSIARIPPQEVP